ncbi:hypothetical protein DFP73DRAFT_553127 [Morchella snyderi]|nr:hypothetical protein DFP73DRAFT_553127 [Morchella snyderi]
MYPAYYTLDLLRGLSFWSALIRPLPLLYLSSVLNVFPPSDTLKELNKKKHTRCHPTGYIKLRSGLFPLTASNYLIPIVIYLPAVHMPC